MRARQKRMVFVCVAIVGVGIAASLALSALQSNIAYFFSPAQVMAKHDDSYMPPEVADTRQTAHVEGVAGSAAQQMKLGGVA